MSLARSLPLSLLLLCIATCTAQASIQSMQSYSLIVFGDLDISSNVQGRAFIGGNITGQNSADFAANSVGVAPTDVSLRVGGNINTGNPLNIQMGSVEVGGTINRIVNLNGGPGATKSSGILQNISVIQNELIAASAEFAALAPNSTANLVGNQLTFEASPSGATNRAIFNVTAADVFSNGAVGSIDINLNGAAEIIINVSGSTVNFNQGNMVGNFPLLSTKEKVLWNFYEATSITTDRRLDGSTLAPLAHMTNNASLDGSVAVASMTQRAQTHYPMPTLSPDPDPMSAPEPASLIMWLAAVVLNIAGGRPLRG